MGICIKNPDTTSDYTIESFNANARSQGDKVDFQVRSNIGYSTWVPDPLRSGFFMEGTLKFTGESSDWSVTKTVTFQGESSSEPTVTSVPSESPFPSVPEIPIMVILPLFVVIPLITVMILRKSRHLKPYN